MKKTMDEFAEAVKKTIEGCMEGALVTLQAVVKNNGCSLTGLSIRRYGCPISPVVYLNPFYSQWMEGKSLQAICIDVLVACKNAEQDNIAEIDADTISDFTKMKDKICFKLVNADKNRERLQQMPHRLCYDLAAIYYVQVYETKDSIGNVTVTDDLMKQWGTDEKTLNELARSNTPRIRKCVMFPMETLINEMLGMSVDKVEPICIGDFELTIADRIEATAQEPQMYVATNTLRKNGAVNMIIPEFLEEAGKQIGSFFILPSSIHETLFMTNTSESDALDVLEIVRDVNRTAVDPDEVLSDNVYFYNADKKRVVMIAA